MGFSILEFETWEIRYSATCSVTLLPSSLSPPKIIYTLLSFSLNNEPIIIASNV